MKQSVYTILWIIFFTVLKVSFVVAQENLIKSDYQQVNTYVNPVLPGDHPDPTLLKVGDDFYHCGSSFHFTPYMPVYHSKDLLHWEVIGRVLPPSKAGWVSDRPSAVELVASSGAKGKLEIWLDDLKNGKLIATIPVSATGGEMNLKNFSKPVKNVSGHHNVFIKFTTGKEGTINIKSLRFLK